MNRLLLQQEYDVFDSVTSSSYEANETAFNPVPYIPTDNVNSQHNFFRFGHTNNFESLITGLSGNNEMATDYILGVTASSMLIFGIALVWFLVIMCFKCAGQTKVGFLAGRLESPARQSSLPSIEECLTEDDEDVVSTETPVVLQHSSVSPGPEIFTGGADLDQEKKEKKFKRTALAVRVVFVLSGLCVMVSGALFYAKGVTAFQGSLSGVQDSLSIVESAALETANLTRSLLHTKQETLTGLENTLSETGEGFCQGSSPLAAEISQGGQELSKEIKDINSMVDESLKNLSQDLMLVAKTAKGVNKDLQTAQGFFYALIAVSIIIIVLICTMLAVTVLSARGISNCFTKCVTCALIWPVFVFFLVLSWIFATLFLVFSLAGSDFCFKPDQMVTTLLNNNKDMFNSMVFSFAIYYVSGCEVVPSGMDNIQRLVDTAKTLSDAASNLADKIASQSIDELATGCGLDNAGATALQKGATLIFEASDRLVAYLASFKRIISCENINPIYTSLVYDATCTDAVDGFTWLYSSCLALCIFAMIMITCRAALYPVKRPDGEDRSGLSAPLLSSKNGY